MSRQRFPRLMRLLLTILSWALAFSDSGPIDQGEPNLSYGIRQSLQAYLDAYFDPANPHTQHERTLLSASIVRTHVATCLTLSQARMRDYRDIYREEADVAAIRMNVRQDDALRLFLDADLVTCLANMHDGKVAGSFDENSKFAADDLARLFARTREMRTMLTTDEEFALEAIVDQYMSLADEADKEGLIQRIIQSTEKLPISDLGGQTGFVICACLIASFALGLYCYDNWIVARDSKLEPPESAAVLAEPQLRPSGTKKRATKKK